MSIMLKSTFEATQRDIAEILSHRDYQTGETWHEFCRKRGFSMGEMLSGFDMTERLQERFKSDPPAHVQAMRNDR